MDDVLAIRAARNQRVKVNDAADIVIRTGKCVFEVADNRSRKLKVARLPPLHHARGQLLQVALHQYIGLEDRRTNRVVARKLHCLARAFPPPACTHGVLQYAVGKAVITFLLCAIVRVELRSKKIGLSTRFAGAVGAPTLNTPTGIGYQPS